MPAAGGEGCARRLAGVRAGGAAVDRPRRALRAARLGAGRSALLRGAVAISRDPLRGRGHLGVTGAKKSARRSRGELRELLLVSFQNDVVSFASNFDGDQDDLRSSPPRRGGAAQDTRGGCGTAVGNVAAHEAARA